MKCSTRFKLENLRGLVWIAIAMITYYGVNLLITGVIIREATSADTHLDIVSPADQLIGIGSWVTVFSLVLIATMTLRAWIGRKVAESGPRD